MIADALAAVRDRMARAAARAGRDAAEVRLVAVSKTFPPEAVGEAFAAGIRDFGENRVQEAEEKIDALAALREQGLRWHLIGHLQANKARKAVSLFHSVHSVESVELARRLSRLAAEAGRELPVLVQVDLAGEETKFGLPGADLLPALAQIRELAGLRVLGLMVLPPYDEDAEAVRPHFRRLRELREEALGRGLLAGAELSMGMSHDFEVAIEEGATQIRVGSALFGSRPSRI